MQNACNINIYPNPAGEILHIEGLQKETVGSIYNANGQMIFSKTVDAYNGDINVSLLPTGLYILKLETEKGIVLRKVSIN